MILGQLKIGARQAKNAPLQETLSLFLFTVTVHFFLKPKFYLLKLSKLHICYCWCCTVASCRFHGCWKLFSLWHLKPTTWQVGYPKYSHSIPHHYQILFPVYRAWRVIVMIIVIIRDLSLPLLSQSLLFFCDSAWGPFLLERREVQGKAGRHKKSKKRRRDIYFLNNFEKKRQIKVPGQFRRNQNTVNPTKKLRRRAI